MVNKKGGKGYKKGKKGGGKPSQFEVAEDEQEYAKIVKKLGDRRFTLQLHSSKETAIGRTRGSLKGGHSLRPDDIVLVSGRDFRQSEKDQFVQNVYDIIGIYTNDQVRKLLKMGEIVDTTFGRILEEDGQNDFDFDEDIEEEEQEIAPQREIRMPSSDSESDGEDNVDIDDI